jgi:hypothetical protein
MAHPNGKKKDKVLLKEKEIIKATLQELSIGTPVDGGNLVSINNNSLNDATKEIFLQICY